jgi:hypothetical protein
MKTSGLLGNGAKGDERRTWNEIGTYTRKALEAHTFRQQFGDHISDLSAEETGKAVSGSERCIVDRVNDSWISLVPRKPMEEKGVHCDKSNINQYMIQEDGVGLKQTNWNFHTTTVANERSRQSN